MNIPGTLAFADLYGPKTPNGQENQPGHSERSSGGIPSNGQDPAFAWLGLLLALVILRVLEHFAS